MFKENINKYIHKIETLEKCYADLRKDYDTILLEYAEHKMKSANSDFQEMYDRVKREYDILSEKYKNLQNEYDLIQNLNVHHVAKIYELRELIIKMQKDFKEKV